MFLENVQIIKENDKPRFAVLDFSEFNKIRDLLSNESQLEDYLDYLHMQNVKMKSRKKYTLNEVKKELFG